MIKKKDLCKDYIIHDFQSSKEVFKTLVRREVVGLKGSKTTNVKDKLSLPVYLGLTPARKNFKNFRKSFEKTPGTAMLNPWKLWPMVDCQAALLVLIVGAVSQGHLESPMGAAHCSPASLAWRSPPEQSLRMGHFLDSDTTWQFAASSHPARPASRTRVSKPQAEPQVFPLCMQGLQLPQGPSSHSSVGWRERQTDRWSQLAISVLQIQGPGLWGLIP